MTQRYDKELILHFTSLVIFAMAVGHSSFNHDQD